MDQPPKNTALEPTAAPLLRSTVPAGRTRTVRSTRPADGVLSLRSLDHHARREHSLP